MRVFDPDCKRCPRLADFLLGCRQTHPGHFGKPVPPFGDEQAGLLVVGLAPGYNGANRTGRPFTGDFCGDLLYGTLHAHGFGSQPQSVAADDGLRLINCRVTNAVKCVPPQNKPTPLEIRTCNGFLKAELQQQPPRVIVALGVVAHDATLMAMGYTKTAFKFAHGARHSLAAGGHRVDLLDSYHVSRYNTQTGRLTPVMFDAVIAQARTLLENPA
jgi:uracil-DNA glycosylase family 4